MIDFIKINYEWIFSGIGVLIISIIYGFFKKKKTKYSNSINLKNVSVKDSSNTNIQIANNLANNNIVVETVVSSIVEPEIIYDKEPIDIIETVGNVPPFQKDSIEASFNGLLVNWVVSFYSILSKKDNIVKVMTNYKQNYPWIYFEIDIEKYPIFKVARQYEEFIITGKIMKVSRHDIDINIESIKKK